VLFLTCRRIGGCFGVPPIKDLKTRLENISDVQLSLQLIEAQYILTSKAPDEETFESNFGHQCLSHSARR
jgi:hypothetical protein